jgi:opacity protein-like surface antigen
VKSADDNRATILFDNNLDGNFGDTVRTAAGANAFSPGFCGGTPNTAIAGNGCEDDNDEGVTYGVHAGYDFDFGPVVLGALVEYDRSNIEDAVTAFSTTPANYSLNRKLRGTLGVRGRLGLDAGAFLPYVTVGLVRARIKNNFTTTNTANAFALNEGSHRETGYRVGGGAETMVGQLSLGLLYLYTNVKDRDARVTVTRGTAPATNPFVLLNPNGTVFRRSDDRFKTHSLSLTASLRFGGRAAAPPPPPAAPVAPPPPAPPPPTQTCPDGSVVLATDQCPALPPPPPPPAPAPERG